MTVDAAVVGKHLQVGGVTGGDRGDQLVRDSAQPEPADRQRRTGRDVRDRFGCRTVHLARHRPPAFASPGTTVLSISSRSSSSAYGQYP